MDRTICTDRGQQNKLFNQYKTLGHHHLHKKPKQMAAARLLQWRNRQHSCWLAEVLASFSSQVLLHFFRSSDFIFISYKLRVILIRDQDTKEKSLKLGYANFPRRKLNCKKCWACGRGMTFPKLSFWTLLKYSLSMLKSSRQTRNVE